MLFKSSIILDLQSKNISMKFILTTITVLLVVLVYGQAPTAQFTASPLSVCVGSPVSFTNQSTSALPIQSYSWDFGDGNSSNTANTSHVYATPGTYTVTLVVVNSVGTADAEVKTNYITVNPVPTASFTTSGNGCTVPFGVTFTNTSTGGNSYSWNFGNGQTSTQQNPSVVTYNTAGTYNVTLTTTNSAGCQATSTQSLVVSNYTAGITAQSSVCVDQSVTFTNSSTVGSNQWSWNFGNGQTSNQQNPSTTYSTPGTYTVTLTSQNTNSGCSGTATHQITVLPKPVPSFTATINSECAPTLVNFTNNSPSGQGFVWNFGNGQTFNGQNPPPIPYNANGSYSVSLTMVGDNGCSGSVSIANYVVLTNPVAQFTATPVNGCDPLDVVFIDNSNSPNPATNPIVSWEWNFGNGSTFSGQYPPIQTYNVGVYDVTLIITTQTGCKDTTTLLEYIQVGLIDQVNFTVDPTIECAKTTIDYTNTTVITAPHDESEITYFWDFGDNQNSTLENPTHQYVSDTGYYDVTLIVDFRGCKDTLIVEDAVYIKAPISNFTVDNPLNCNPASLPVNVVVTDEAIHGVASDDVQMIWRWGDGTTTVLDDPDLDDADLGSTSHNYANYGTYTIKQVIHNFTTGCSDSTTNVVHISRIDAIFTVANDSVCKNSLLQLTGSSSTTWDQAPTPHPITSWSYNMGNGQTVNNGANPTYAYPQAGTFTITLTTTNSVGCTDQATFTPVTSLELPLGQITADDNAGCAPFLVTFTNGSSVQGNGVPLESFTFTFSDNNSTQTTTSVNQTVSHTFTTEGNFNATLVATDEFGCNSLPVSTQIVITKPAANFTIPEVVCNNEQVVTANATTGSGPITYEWFVDGQSASTNIDFTATYNEASNPAINHIDHDYVLIATDVNGCKDTLEQTITVSKPVAIIDFDLNGASVNANGEFTCPPVFGTYADETNTYGDIVTWGWVFGDGKQSSLENPQNTYVFPGTYTITLSIEDEYGCTDDTTLTDYLTIFGPTGEPDWFQEPGQCGQHINFELNNPDNVVGIIWSPGDGTTMNDSSEFTHVYTEVNTFNPTVTLIDQFGCEVIYEMDPVTIPESGLNAYFVPNSAELDLGVAFVFDDQSTFGAPIVSWSWTFGNGNDTILNNDSDQTQTYYLGGPKLITLTVVDANGCFDSYQFLINVNSDFQMPNVFTPNGDGSNDQFALILDVFNTFDLTIQNRWGNIVKQQTNMSGIALWDGLDQNGNSCSDGVYYYQINGILKDGISISKNGFVTKIGTK